MVRYFGHSDVTKCQRCHQSPGPHRTTTFYFTANFFFHLQSNSCTQCAQSRLPRTLNWMLNLMLDNSVLKLDYFNYNYNKYKSPQNIRKPSLWKNYTHKYGKEFTNTPQVHFDVKSWLHLLRVWAYVMLCCVALREMTDFTQVAQFMRSGRCRLEREGSPLLLIATHMCSAEVGLQISVCLTLPPSVWTLTTQTVGWPLWLLQIWPFSALLKLAGVVIVT